ncbi:MAG: 2-amino-4-hydroxy-6-hydroxymethyldihydropteridine diphosphokinase [Candidatus Marinimicrobia bacterium]|nr:2-amino-4-hydroxy-6-hydroxymethyldihydropteridine diphosphokinase [Candidatus Neomarinimicrobiota bacterium]
MTRVLLSIGSNQKDPQTQIRNAYHSLCKDFTNLHLSRLYITEPVGYQAQPPFINAAITLETNYTAPELLKVLHDIELKTGRSRQTESRNGPRTLDLDIILFGNEIWSESEICIPHPRFRSRRFVLTPAAEIASEMCDPEGRKTISQYLDECSDKHWVRLIEEPVEAL